MRGWRIVFSGTHQAAWEAFELPDAPGPRQVLLQTLWTAVSTGTETAIYAGTHIGFTVPGAAYPQYPHRPGYAAVGKVLAVGSEVRGVAPGQQVCFRGPHSSHAVWDMNQREGALLPPGVSPDAGALAGLCTISLNGVRLGQVALGDTVAVIGAGLIGQFAGQFARLSGGRPVILADLVADRLEVARRCGIELRIDAAEQDIVVVGRELTGGRGFDVVVEATGAPPAVAQALALAAEYARVVLLGSPRGRVEIDPYSHIHRLGVTVVGAHELTTPRAATIHSRWTRQRNLQLVLDLLATGDLVAGPLISHRIPAMDATALFAELVRRPNDYLGVVFDWTAFEAPGRAAGG